MAADEVVVEVDSAVEEGADEAVGLATVVDSVEEAGEVVGIVVAEVSLGCDIELVVKWKFRLMCLEGVTLLSENKSHYGSARSEGGPLGWSTCLRERLAFFILPRFPLGRNPACAMSAETSLQS